MGRRDGGFGGRRTGGRGQSPSLSLPPSSALRPLSSAVCIVGLGPVGALLANLLGARGLRVVVLERDPAPYTLPRAAHLDDEAMRVLQAAGLADAVAAHARPLDGMDVVDARGRVLVRARKRGARDEPLGWPAAQLIHQPTVERVLREGLARFPTVEVRLGHTVEAVDVEADGVTLTVARPEGTYHERAAWVVGCDGARSRVRDAMGSTPTPPGRAFEERWLVVDVRLRREVPLPDRLLQIADPARPTTFVPFPGERRRWEFRLRPDETPDAMTQPDAVARLLAPHVDASAVEVERAVVYAFRALVADRWRRGRLLLAGDAAHQMPPFLGQGLCAGLRDAAFLGWALPLVAAGAAGPALLDAYAAERRPHVAAVARLAARAGRMIGLPPRAARARDGLLALAHRLPFFHRRLLDVEGDIPPIRAVVAGRGGQPLRLLPQPWVEAPDGARLRLDDVLGTGWAVVGLGLDPLRWFTPGGDPLWVPLPTRLVRVLAPGEPWPDDLAGKPTVRDPGGRLAAWAGRAPAAVVVRPDRYVFGVYDAPRSARASADLRCALGLG